MARFKHSKEKTLIKREWTEEDRKNFQELFELLNRKDVYVPARMSDDISKPFHDDFSK